MDRNIELAKAISAFVHLLKDALPIRIDPRELARSGQVEGTPEMVNQIRQLITGQLGLIPTEAVEEMTAWVDHWYAAATLGVIAEGHANPAERVAAIRAYETLMARVKELQRSLSARYGKTSR